MKWVVLILIFMIGFVSAGIGGTIGLDLNVNPLDINLGGNYSINVNNTDHLQGYTVGTLWTYFTGLGNNLYCELTGCTMTGNIDSSYDLTTTGTAYLGTIDLGTNTINNTGWIGNMKVIGDLNVTGYGFFSWLGNLANKITSIFATTIHTETLNSTGTIYSNQTCYTQDCSAKIYHNGTGIIITS